MSTTLKEVLFQNVREGARELWEPIDKNRKIGRAHV